MEEDAGDVHTDLKLPCMSGGDEGSDGKQNPENESTERDNDIDADPVHEGQSDGKECSTDIKLTLHSCLDSHKLSPNLEEDSGIAALQPSDGAETAEALDT